MACLLISIEPQTRRVWAHQIFAGQPRERQARQFLSDSRSAGNCKWSGRKIGFTDHELIGFVSSLRSEEHTSELQSLMRISYAVFCLKKKKIKKLNINGAQINKQYKVHKKLQKSESSHTRTHSK